MGMVASIVLTVSTACITVLLLHAHVSHCTVKIRMYKLLPSKWCSESI